MRADFLVTAPSGDGVSAAIEPELAALGSVEVVSPVRKARASIVSDDALSVTPAAGADATAPVQADAVAGVDPATVEKVFDADVVSGRLQDLTTTGIAVKRSEAEAKHLALGDQVQATFKNGVAVPLTVTAIYAADLAASGNSSYLVALDTLEANGGDELDALVLVKTRGGVVAPTARAELDQVMTSYPNAELLDHAEVKETIAKEIDQMLNLIYGLLVLAIVIALIGIANTLALSVHERTRELGLLRAVGMTRRQMRGAIRWESVIIALLGTGLGFALGIGGAWGLARAMSGKGLSAFVVPPATMTAIAVMAVGAGVVAALGPARRAGRLNILKAIATD
jgi:putative ABC transport system permease protein